MGMNSLDPAPLTWGHFLQTRRVTGSEIPLPGKQSVHPSVDSREPALSAQVRADHSFKRVPGHRSAKVTVGEGATQAVDSFLSRAFVTICFMC